MNVVQNIMKQNSLTLPKYHHMKGDAWENVSFKESVITQIYFNWKKCCVCCFSYYMVPFTHTHIF